MARSARGVTLRVSARARRTSPNPPGLSLSGFSLLELQQPSGEAPCGPVATPPSRCKPPARRSCVMAGVVMAGAACAIPVQAAQRPQQRLRVTSLASRVSAFSGRNGLRLAGAQPHRRAFVRGAGKCAPPTHPPRGPRPAIRYGNGHLRLSQSGVPSPRLSLGRSPTSWHIVPLTPRPLHPSCPSPDAVRAMADNVVNAASTVQTAPAAGHANAHSPPPGALQIGRRGAAESRLPVYCQPAGGCFELSYFRPASRLRAFWRAHSPLV